MDGEIEKLLVRVEANAAQFEGQMKRINRALGNSQKDAQRELRKINRDFDRAWSNAGRSMYQPIQLGATVALGAITAMSYQAAKRAEDVNGAFDQTFRAMPEKASAATKAISTEFKRLETDVKDNFTQMQAVMIGLGVDAEQSLAIVDQLQRRSLDMAAFKGGTDAQAFQAVISGITGETEPLKRFGIVVNETTVKAELLRLGFKGNAQQASEAAKAIARANLILAKSAEMHGQVSREAGNAANKEKEVQAAFVGSAEKLGKNFLPVAVKVLDWAGAALDKFNAMPSAAQNAGLGFLALVAVGGPLLSTINMLRELVKTAIAARVALAAVGGSSAAGAAGGTAAGVAGGAASRIAPLATGALVAGGMLASFAPAPYRGDDLEKQLEQARKDQQRADALAKDTFLKSDAVVRRQRQGLAAANARVSDLSRQIATRDAAAQRQQAERVQSQADREASAALAGLGGFALSPDQMSAIGGGGGSAASGAAAARAAEADAARLASRREELSLQRAIDLARASGDKAAERAAEERQNLAQLTAQYADAGYSDAVSQAMEHLALLNQAEMAAEARAKTEEQIDAILDGRRRQLERESDFQRAMNEALQERLSFEAQIAGLRGDRRVAEAKERELWIEQRITDLLRDREGPWSAMDLADARSRATGEADAIDDATTRGRFVDMVVKAGTDFEGLTKRAGEGFKQKALEGFGNILFDLVQRAFAAMPNGGGGNFIKSLLDGIPGFATGTASAPGGLAYVHQGEVLTNLKAGTQVIPAHAVRALGALGDAQRGVVPGLGSGNSGSLRVSVDVTGANGDAAVAAIAEAAARRGTEAAIAQSRTDQAQATAARRYRLK